MIIVYVSPACQKCKELEAFLKSKKLPVVTRNAFDFAEYLTSQGFYELPVIEINGRLYLYHSQLEITYILRNHGYLLNE